MATYGFLQDDNGKRSAMRAMNFISLLASILFAFLTLTYDVCDVQTGMYITLFFILGAFAPKALQKFAEQPLPTTNGQET